MYSTNEEMIIGIIVVVVLALYLVLMGLGIAGYIMNSIALHKLGSRRQIPNSWIAWIPVASSFLIGSIVDEYDERNGLKRKWRVVLLTLEIIAIGGLIVGYIGLIVWMVAMGIQSEYVSSDVAGIMGGFIIVYALIIVVAIIASAKGFCQAICIYKIFESTVPEKSVKYMLLYLLVPLAGSICLLKCRNQGYSKEIIPNVVEPTYTAMEQEVIPEETIESEEE